MFRSKARGAEGRIGLTSVEFYASAEGLRLYRGHDYELESVYHNTSDEDQDSMAVMLLYVLDRQFRLPRHLAAN